MKCSAVTKVYLTLSRCVLIAFTVLLGVWAATGYTHAQSVLEEDVSFHSGGVALHGTVLIPERSGRIPAIVLVHGAGPGQRDDNRAVAEALVEEGFLTFIYDKRTEGYSTEPVGGRSYSLLADDAVAAVQMLQQRNDVNPDQVGLWGLSEGGWVVPLAATRSTDVAFVITVAGGGVGPAEQTAWATEGVLRRRGVSSEGSLRALTDRTYRFLVSAELFAEGTFDPVPVLEQLQQPVLALWGSEDRTMPAAASARAMQQALESGSNPHYVLHVIPEASHAAYAIVDGQSTGALAAGYVDTMAAWIRSVTAGNAPDPVVDELQADPFPTRLSLANVHGFARWQIQLFFLAAFNLAFGGYFVVAGVRRLRGSRPRLAPGRWSARMLAVLGLIVSWGVYGYTGYIAATSGVDLVTVVAGRPVGWLVLQVLAYAHLVAAMLLGVAWYRGRQHVPASEHVRYALLLGGVMLFVPWAFWWQLFSL